MTTTLLAPETRMISTRIQQQTFSINFIGQKTVPLKLRRALALAVIIYLVVQATLAVALIGSGALASLQAWGLRNRLSKQTGSIVTLAVLQRDMEPFYAHAAKNLDGLNRIAASWRFRFPIAGKLAGVVKTLPNRTWVTSISSDHKQKVLQLEALYLVNPKSPHKLPLKEWERALRADPVFSRGLKKLSLGQTSSVKQGKADCVRFELVAEW